MYNVRVAASLGRATITIAIGMSSVWFHACGGSKTLADDSGAGSGSDFGCSVSVAGQEYCQAYTNLSSDNLDSARSACSSQDGTVVNACPTSGLVGCCAITQSGMSFQSCYYFGTETSDEMACTAGNGRWTSGSASIGGGGQGGGGGAGGRGGSGGGGGGGGGSTTTTCTGGGLCCPDEYCTLGSAHGFQFAYDDHDDGGSSTAYLTESSCVSGSTVGAICESESSPQTCYESHWGAGLGFNLNQPKTTGATAASFTSAGSKGVTYAIDRLSSTMRLIVGDSTTDYCVNLVSSSGTIPWSSFSSACWSSSGTYLTGPPAKLVSVRFQVQADTSYGDYGTFDFCVTQLSL